MSDYSFIGSGKSNEITGYSNQGVILGGVGNRIDYSEYGSILNGSNNIIGYSNYSVVSGQGNHLLGSGNSYLFGNNLALTEKDTSVNFVIGQYNVDNSALFAVGTGTKDYRRNSFEVYSDGSVQVHKTPELDDEVVRLEELKPLQKLVEGLTDEQIIALNKFAKSLVVTEE